MALAALAVATGLSGCADLTDPRGAVHERVVYDDPVEMVLFVYRNIAEERWENVQSAFLNRADKLTWMAWAESEQPHPWSQDPQVRAMVVGWHEEPDEQLRLEVQEDWSGGSTRRSIWCRETADGWRIIDVDGIMCDGLTGATGLSE